MDIYINDNKLDANGVEKNYAWIIDMLVNFKGNTGFLPDMLNLESDGGNSAVKDNHVYNYNWFYPKTNKRRC
jgi:hypothetical protein